MNRCSWIVGVCVSVLLTSAGLAGEPMEMPKPTAEHEVLGTWVGEWAAQGEIKPGPFGEGGPMSRAERGETERPHDEEVDHRRGLLVLDQLDVAGGECRGCRSREHADDGESGERGAQVSEHG